MKYFLMFLFVVNVCKALEIACFQETSTGFERICGDLTRSQNDDLKSGDYFLLLNVIVECGVERTAVVFSESAKNIHEENLGCRFAPKKQRVNLMRERLLLHLIGWHDYELCQNGEVKERIEYMPLRTDSNSSSSSSMLDLSLLENEGMV